MHFRSYGIALVLSLWPVGVAAQAARVGCSDPAHRQFDFWIGEWTVTNAAGQTVGASLISPILDGCAIEETWTGATGSTGKSFNFFERDRWHQVWVANQVGGVLRLEGGLERGAMVMRGESAGPNGTVLNLIRWEPLEGGRVLQTWEVSSDGGRTWQTSFAGTYAPPPGL
jgi:hypothetical protein